MAPAGASRGRILAVVMGLIVLTGCGSNGSTTTTTTTTTTPTPVANTLSVAVNAGPANNAVNSAYVSVEVCNPGGTTNCVTISDVLVDTGSSGLRILASYPGISGLNLTQVTGSGTPVYECFQYPDGTYLWGPVFQASVLMAGENATNVPIQLIGSGAAPTNVSSICNPFGGGNLGTSTALQANGILGIGTAIQDCGAACAPSASSVLPYYWLCTSSTTCSSAAAVSTATQVSNPVAFFNSSDTNGVILTMSSVGASGATSATGTLVFGIGTETCPGSPAGCTPNALASATTYSLGIWPSGIYALSDTLQSTYNSVAYPAIMDTSSPATYFLDPTTIGVPVCSGNYAGWYCPSSTTSFTVSDIGISGTAANASISIGNAQTLLSNTSLTAFSNLARSSGGTGAMNDLVEFGFPFFYGRAVYVGIAPAGSGGLGYYAF